MTVIFTLQLLAQCSRPPSAAIINRLHSSACLQCNALQGGILLDKPHLLIDTAAASCLSRSLPPPCACPVSRSSSAALCLSRSFAAVLCLSWSSAAASCLSRSSAAARLSRSARQAVEPTAPGERTGRGCRAAKKTCLLPYGLS